jgi:hypothetical protein
MNGLGLATARGSIDPLLELKDLSVELLPAPVWTTSVRRWGLALGR